jgi:two-component system sensor histidine kinase PhoQ
MLGNERRRQERYRNSLADLAHSLKTPLAALRGQQGQPLHDTEPLDRMQQLIDYQLRKAVAGGGRSFTAPLAVAPLVERLVNAMGKVYAGQGIHFDNRVAPHITLRMEQGDQLEVFGNLLDNAARFAHHQIVIAAEQTGQQLLISVSDDGPGFPAQERDNLLKRGIRADSRNPGQGIGLAVVADIVQAHKGTLRLTTSEQGGARVEIRLSMI